MRGRGSDRRTDIVAPRDEPDPGSEACDQASDEGEGEGADEQRNDVSDRDHREREDPEVASAAPVDEPPAGNLHHEVRDEERRRQEADRPQPNVVGVRHDLRGRPDVRDVVADGGTEGDPGRGGD